MFKSGDEVFVKHNIQNGDYNLYKPNSVTFIEFSGSGKTAKLRCFGGRNNGGTVWVLTETLVPKEIAESSLFKIMNEEK